MGKLIRLDLDAVDAGVWVDYGAGFEVRIARLGNSSYTRRVRELIAAFDDKLEVDPTDITNAVDQISRNSQMLHAMKQAASEELVKDWRGREDDDDKPLPYSAAQCLADFLDPETAEFYEWCLSQGGKREHFLKKKVDVAVGKSSAPSDGSDGGEKSLETSQPQPDGATPTQGE